MTLSRPFALLVILSVFARLEPRVARAADSSNTAIEEAIQAVLNELHPTDTPSWWRSLGPEAPGIMISMYRSSSHIYHRLRLIQALGYFDDPAVDAFLKDQALNSPDDVIRNAAVQSIGLSQGAGEEDFIAKFLQNDNPQTRVAAATALKRIGDGKSQSYLEQFYKDEKVAWARDKVKQTPVLPPQPTLRIVRREDRKLSREFSGDWTGFWIEPNPNQAAALSEGLINVVISMKLKLEDATTLTGDLTVKKSGTVFHVANVTGKDNHVSGILWTLAPKSGTTGSAPTTREEFAFHAELLTNGKASIIRIDLPQTLGTILARRSAR